MKKITIAFLQGRAIAIGVSLFFLCMPIFADTQTEVKEYLLKAIDFTCYSSFQCDNLKMFLAGEEVTLRYYHYGKNDEEFYTRYEKNWGNAAVLPYLFPGRMGIFSGASAMER